MRTYKLFVAFLFLIVASSARSQSLIDATRLAGEPIGTGARATAMGGAVIANANDYSALDWNPAALTLMNAAELTISGYYRAHNSTALFLGNSMDESQTNFDLGSFGYAVGLPTRRGHMAFGISYDRVYDYNTTYSFKAVNPNSSLLNTQGFVNDPGFNARTESYQDYLNDLHDNLAWQLYLTNSVADTAHPKLTTPFHGGLQQSGTVTESGGMNAFRLGGGIDIAENVAVGATANIFFGDYSYRREYIETDVNNVVTSPDSGRPNGFKSAQITDTRHQSQTGFSIKLGLLATPSDLFHFGFTIETPEVYSINDQYQRTAVANFKTGLPVNSLDQESLNPVITNNYTVTTPVKLAGGVSFNFSGLTLSAAADFSDMSQLRYSDADADLSDLNDSAKADLKSVLNWKLGAEYVFKPWGLILRAGYAMNPSPYKGDPSNFNTSKISAGIGILMSRSAICEITFLRTAYRTDHLLYSDADITSGNIVTAAIPADDIVQNQVMLSFSFRW
jgi:hypothetical protein